MVGQIWQFVYRVARQRDCCADGNALRSEPPQCSACAARLAYYYINLWFESCPPSRESREPSYRIAEHQAEYLPTLRQPYCSAGATVIDQLQRIVSRA